MNTIQLQAGAFMGDTLKQRILSDYILTMTQHEPHSKVPKHEHQYPYISMLLSGHYREKSLSTDHNILPGYSVFRPHQYEHENMLGEQTGFCFNIEIKKDLFTEKLRLASGSYKHFEKMNLEISKIYFAFTRDLSHELLNIQLEENLYLLFSRFMLEYYVGNAHWISDLKNQVRLNPEKTYRIDNLAQQFEVHPVYLVRKFKEKTGIAFGEYLIRSRLENAIDLMFHTKKSLTMIGYECGFYDQSHFPGTLKLPLKSPLRLIEN